MKGLFYLSYCKIRKVIKFGPCKYPESLVFKLPHTDQSKYLIYKEKVPVLQQTPALVGVTGLEPATSTSRT